MNIIKDRKYFHQIYEWADESNKLVKTANMGPRIFNNLHRGR